MADEKPVLKQYLVVKNQQISVEATDPDDAVVKALQGQGVAGAVSYNAQIRPQPAARPTPSAGVGARPNA